MITSRTFRRRCVACCVLATPVFAGPPLITDDPDTLPRGEFELNTAYTLTVGASGPGGRAWEHEAPLFDLNYGLLDWLQLKFETAFSVVDDADGEGSRFGLGDLSLGAKIRFLDEAEAPLSLSIYPALGAPTGDSHRGLGAGSPSLTFPAQLGRHFLDDSLFLYADAGYEEQLAEGEDDLWFVGFAAEYEVREGFVLCGEVRREFGVRGAPDDTLFNIGFKATLTEHAALIAAFGRSFDPTPDSGSDFMMYFGVQWSF